MRSDAGALLEKLDRKGFDYRQFPDRYADLELWPIFEALLADPRILERKLSQVELRSRDLENLARPEGPPVEMPAGHPLQPQFSSLLSAYGPKPVEDVEDAGFATLPETSLAPQQPARPDLKTFLNNLGRGE